MNASCEKVSVEQGTGEWLELRRTKITATDAAVIMGMNPWKSIHTLYREKTEGARSFRTPAMQRGIDLEPEARLQFTLLTGTHTEPGVFVKGWQMASVDGISEDGKSLLEIKCPGDEAHQSALKGIVPTYYRPQLQHQMHVLGLKQMFYFSFDGASGVSILVDRDQEFIDLMCIAEREFYDCLINKTPPEDEDFVAKTDGEWYDAAERYIRCKKAIQDLEDESNYLRNRLIDMSRDKNSKGCGIKVSKITVKGNVDFSAIPELRQIDLEAFRKPSKDQWRILID